MTRTINKPTPFQVVLHKYLETCKEDEDPIWVERANPKHCRRQSSPYENKPTTISLRLQCQMPSCWTRPHLCNGHPACFHSDCRRHKGHRCTDRRRPSFFFQVSTSSKRYQVSPFVGLRATSKKRCVHLRHADSCWAQLLETSPECSALFAVMHPTSKDR